MKKRKLSGFVAVVILCIGVFSGGLNAVAASDGIHSYTHSAKLRKDASGVIINETKFADSDEGTYPFLYRAYNSYGSDWNLPGSQKLPKTLLSESNRDGVPGYLYQAGTWTGIRPDGGIASVSGDDYNEAGLIYTFISPYAGELSITDMFVDYSWWGYVNGIVIEAGNEYHGERKYHMLNGVYYNQAFGGYAFRVEVNGRRVYPADDEWDTTAFAKKYSEETPLGDDTLPNAKFEAGDLMFGKQYAPVIDGIYVRRHDEVDIILTSPQLPAVTMCVDSGFDVTCTVDASAEISDYRYTCSVLDTFTIADKNDGNNLLSYWYYDVTGGLYGEAKRTLMKEIDYANGMICSQLFGDSASVNYNSLTPAVGYDAALCYRAPVRGNLRISTNNLYRGKDMALYKYFDALDTDSAEILNDCDGVRLRIELNGSRIYPTDVSWLTYKPDVNNRGRFDWNDVTLGVQAGDTVTIRVNAGKNATYDALNFSPYFDLIETAEPVKNAPVTVSDGEDDIRKNGALPWILAALGVTVAAAGAVVTVALIRKNRKKKSKV